MHHVTSAPCTLHPLNPATWPGEEEGHHDLFMDPGEKVRFRVTRETFVDTGPTKPKVEGEPPLGCAKIFKIIQNVIKKNQI